MNKNHLTSIVIVGVTLGIYLAILPDKVSEEILDSPQIQTNAKTPQSTARQHKHSDSERAETTVSHQHETMNGFKFDNYVSEEMAEELRAVTSRDSSDLPVQKDTDGHEYVDLKKRWSHATISVIDEDGKKHTGEWAPKSVTKSSE